MAGYLVIGYLVTLFMIHYYRYIKNGPVEKSDAILGCIGPFIWPLLLIKFSMDLADEAKK